MCRRRILLLPVLLLALTLQQPCTSATNTTHICVSTFTTNEELNNLPWSSISDLIQSISPVILDHTGAITTTAATWPMNTLISYAHGNSTKMWVGVHLQSKTKATQFFASAPSLLNQTAYQLVQLISDANYDGLQLDVEGLHIDSKAGYETFVSACHMACTALTHQHPAKPIRLSTTLYVNILLKPASQASAYDAQYLSTLGQGLFIMGYDMTWLNAKPGHGWERAGPVAPLDGLNAALHRAITINGVDPTQIVLGLPAYGRVSTCDGDPATMATPSAPTFRNCSCTEKNFHKKSLDIMASVVTAPGCTTGYDTTTATPYWDCPYGSNTTHANNPHHLRQQGWYENVPSMTAKFNLMKQWGIPGVGLWTASGIAQSTPENSGIWELFKVWQGPGSGGSNGGSTTPSRAPSPESSGSGSNNPSPWTPPIPPTSPSPESTPDNGSGNDGNNNNGAKDKDDDHSGAVIAVVVCLLLVVAGGGVGYLVYQRKQNYGFATNTAGMELLAKEIR